MDEAVKKRKAARAARRQRMVELYRQNHTLQSIADRFGITRQKVQQILKAMKCPRRSMLVKRILPKKKKDRLIPKEQLRELYIEKKLPVREIVKIFGTTQYVIYQSLDFHGLERREDSSLLPLLENCPEIPQGTLYQLYAIDKLSVIEIAKEYGYTVQQLKDKFGDKKIVGNKIRKSVSQQCAKKIFFAAKATKSNVWVSIRVNKSNR